MRNRPIARALAAAALVAITAGGCATGRPTPGTERDLAARREAESRAAARQRAEAQALREQEQRACVGVSDEDRDRGLLAHPERIEGVEALLERVVAKAPPARTVGAVVHLRGTAGMTEQYLRRILLCHMAHDRSAAGATERAACPLAVADAQMDVDAGPMGFTLTIRSLDFALEVFQRCQAIGSAAQR